MLTGIFKRFKPNVRFDRHEWAGSFGDIGTDFPLITGMILASGMDVASACIVFGMMQVFSGLVYGLPMPVQPLKAMAVIVISQKLNPDILYGGGLAIGMVMLVFSLTGIISWITRVIPKVVVRGIQFGLGIQLAGLALKDYVPSDGQWGYALAGVSVLLVLFLLKNRRYPPALFVILLGVVYAFIFKLNLSDLVDGVGFNLPRWHAPKMSDILTGFLVLSLPQIPLSIGNSILATRQTVRDLFPGRDVGVRRISFTYALMNLVSSSLSGIPVCHGSGGLVGHYTFGARSGGSVIIYGMIYLSIGFFFSHAFSHIIQLFPKPVLGVILLFEGLGLMRLIDDIKAKRGELSLAILVGLLAVNLPYGYVVGLIFGTGLYYLAEKKFADLPE